MFLMESDNLKQLLDALIDFLENSEDVQKAQYLINELKKINKHIPTYSKLEELHKIAVDLDVQYDSFNDLLYYFDPLYAMIERVIHEEEVKKIRQENKEKKL